MLFSRLHSLASMSATASSTVVLNVTPVRYSKDAYWIHSSVLKWYFSMRHSYAWFCFRIFAFSIRLRLSLIWWICLLQSHVFFIWNLEISFHWFYMNIDRFLNSFMWKGKKAGSDKKLYKSLEQQYQEEIARSPDPSVLSVSPFGPLTEKSSRLTLIELISTLNAAFPDYDFSWAFYSILLLSLVYVSDKKETNALSSLSSLVKLSLQRSESWTISKRALPSRRCYTHWHNAQ